MCDENGSDGVIWAKALSRRSFGLGTVAAPGLAGAAAAQGAVVERDVDVATPDGTADAVLFHPSGPGRWPAVVIWTDVVGLRPAFREMGRRLAADGRVVLVPNVYYRKRRAPVTDAGFDFRKPEDAAKVIAMAGELTAEGSRRDAIAFLAFLDAQPQVNTQVKAGVQGYCLGGPLTLRTAAAVPGRVGAAAIFHGTYLVTDGPDSPHRVIPAMKASVLCAFASNDDRREPAVKDRLRADFAAAELPARVEVFGDANHGWCVPDHTAYNEAAAERAWSALKDLYAGALV